jgi:ParB family chromosome partitioning protein
MPPDKVRRLGRGLEALLAPTTGQTADLRASGRNDSPSAQGFRSVAVSSIATNPLQPRKDFDPLELEELKSSIRSSGLLQPLLVRPKAGAFELVAGERRFRAIQSLGWREVPVHVRELDDQAVLTLALIENLQRADLNPIEEAEGYQELIARFSLTQQQVADAVGRERSTVANMLRMLALPDSVRKMVRVGELSLGHARALLGLGDATKILLLATEVVAAGITVREVERRVREASSAKPAQRKSREASTPSRPAAVNGVEDQLRKRFQTDVTVSLSGENRGEVRLAFYSTDDFERLLDLLLGAQREIL